MKKCLTLLTVIFMIILSSCENRIPASINIIPQPELLELVSEQFTINSETKLEVNNNECLLIANYIADKVSKFSEIDLNIYDEREIDQTENIIFLSIINADKYDLGTEGYQLDVGKRLIHIIANDTIGLFWGAQSLFQLFPVEVLREDLNPTEVSIPGVHIEDKPRFPYRGMHLDVCRHMFPVEFIKKYIDLLALYKFNTFHWHLTEDQGWRIVVRHHRQA